MQDPVDYRSAYRHSPVAQMITRKRIIADCSVLFAEMFRTTREELVGQTVRVLYPTQLDFEKSGRRVVPILASKGYFSDSRVMRRMDGELFWVNVYGFSEHRDDPYAEALWMFADMPADPAGDGLPRVSSRQLDSDARGSMTPRERDVAALLIQGGTAKQIGKALNISPRTVEVYRTRLLRKFHVRSTAALVQSLLSD